MDNLKTGSMAKEELVNEAQTKVPVLIGRLGKNANGENAYSETITEAMTTLDFFTKVNMRPNPFFTALTLEVSSSQNKQVIVRLMSPEGQIMKLFGWYLLKGTNVTTINELGSLRGGEYQLDIMDNIGGLLYSGPLKKA